MRRLWVIAALALASCGSESLETGDAGAPPLPGLAPIATQRPGPRSIVADGARVCWIEPEVIVCASEGSVATLVRTPAHALALGAGLIYYAAEGGVLRVPAESGEPQRVAGSADDLGADDAHVYAASSELWRMRHDGAGEPRWPNVSMPGGTFAVGPHHVCTIDAAGVLRCASKADGEVRLLARGFSEHRALAVSGAHVYACDGDMELLMRVRLAGGAPELVDDSCARGSAIAADDAHVYLVDLRGAVHRIHPERGDDIVMGHLSAGRTARVGVALTGPRLYVAADSNRAERRASGAATHHGVVAVFAADRRPEALMPPGRIGFLAWIGADGGLRVEHVALRLERASHAVREGVALGTIPVRLATRDGAFARRLAEALERRLRASFGARVRVIVDPDWPRRGSPAEVEVLLDLAEVARAYR